MPCWGRAECTFLRHCPALFAHTLHPNKPLSTALWPGAWLPLEHLWHAHRNNGRRARKSRRGATNSQNQLTMPAAPQMQVNPPGSPQSACCSRLQRQTLHTAATQQWQARALRIANTTAASYFGCGQGARGTRSDQQSPLSAPMLHTISCITLACLHAMGIAHQVPAAHIHTDVEQLAPSAQVAVTPRWWDEGGRVGKI